MPPLLLQAVEAHRAAREDLALGLGRQLRPIGDQLRRAREESVGVRVVGRPQDLVRADVVREHRSEEHTSELQSQSNLVCRLLLEKKKSMKLYSQGQQR